MSELRVHMFVSYVYMCLCVHLCVVQAIISKYVLVSQHSDVFGCSIGCLA